MITLSCTLTEHNSPRDTPWLSTIAGSSGYGYFWWLGAASVGDIPAPWIAAFGNGGQRLFVLPELELVVAVTAGRYNQPDGWRTPMAVLTQFVVPALTIGPRD